MPSIRRWRISGPEDGPGWGDGADAAEVECSESKLRVDHSGDGLDAARAPGGCKSIEVFSGLEEKEESLERPAARECLAYHAREAERAKTLVMAVLKSLRCAFDGERRPETNSGDCGLEGREVGIFGIFQEGEDGDRFFHPLERANLLVMAIPGTVAAAVLGPGCGVSAASPAWVL